MITIDRGLLLNGEPDAELLRVVLTVFREERKRLDDLKNIYERKHAIASRSRLRGLPNNRLIHDYPGYIVAITSGYLVGKPVTYAAPDGQEERFVAVSTALKAACVDSVDAELAVDAAIYGKGVELCYANDNAEPRTAQVDARAAFVVYDDTVEHRPLFGVRLRDKQNRLLERIGEYVMVYTDDQIITMERIGAEAPHETSRERHFFGQVPLTEYWNNDRESGDFEPVQSLIDGYDILQSDRVNDKQQFTDSILVLKGVGSLGVDDTQEQRTDDEGNAVEATAGQKEETEPSARLRQTRTLFLPGDGADADFVTKPDTESGNETLRTSLKGDIHKFSLVPDLTDENFAGNASGVAMKYKLFGLEQLTNVKERWFREGLRQRLRMFCRFLALRGSATVNADDVQITFTRSLPVNDLEIAQTVTTYDGMVPKELLLAQVPFVTDVDEAMKMLEGEQQEAVKRQQAAMGPMAFREDKEKPPEGGEEE